MAYDYKSVELTNEDASPKTMEEGTQFGGKVRCYTAKYEASALATGKTVEMVRIPKDHMIIDMFLVTDALGATQTIAVGDGTTADKYMSAATLNTANLRTQCDDGALAETWLSAEESIVLTTAGGATATGTIKLVVLVIGKGD